MGTVMENLIKTTQHIKPEDQLLAIYRFNTSDIREDIDAICQEYRKCCEQMCITPIVLNHQF